MTASHDADLIAGSTKKEGEKSAVCGCGSMIKRVQTEKFA